MEAEATFREPQQLTIEDRDFINRLMMYENHDVVNRLMVQQKCALEEAQEAWVAWKQFAATAYFMKGRKTTSRYVDEIWHIFILHIRQYAEFCEKYWGGYFMHHEPSSDDLSPSYYEKTHDFATQIFGTLNEKIWPLEAQMGARCLSGGDCKIGPIKG